MAESQITWVPRGAWEGIASAGSFGAERHAGVTAQLLEGFSLAALVAPSGGSAALEMFLQSRLALALPATSSLVSNSNYDAIWSGPDQWLLRSHSPQGFSALLDALTAHAAVSEQSDAYASLRLSGPDVRTVLAKGVMIDLHPRVFPVGHVALTSISHIGAQIWRLADGPSGSVFEIAIARSMARSWWTWFAASAAEYGCLISTGRD